MVFDPDRCRGLARVIEEFRPEVVVDLSDEPVLGYEQRFRLISESLARDVGYVGPDFHFSPASSDRLCTSPSLSIIGTGKRVGKTAVSGYRRAGSSGSRHRADGGPGVVVVAMGRGGPAEPEVIDGASAGVSMADLLAWSRQGRHAASDHFEDAVLSRVTTVGCRRCGGGMAGEPFVSNVADGVEAGEQSGPRSGHARGERGGRRRRWVPMRACWWLGRTSRWSIIAGYLGTYRLLISDAVVLTMAEEPLASRGEGARGDEKGGRGQAGDGRRSRGVQAPSGWKTSRGRRVAFFSTAPAAQEAMLRGVPGGALGVQGGAVLGAIWPTGRR